MQNLVIDIGNTFSKIALFNDQDILKVSVFPTLGTDTIDNFLDGQSVENAIVSTVRNEIGSIETYLQHFTRYIRFSSSVNTSLNIHYKTPHTLGLDRLAAVTGASALFENTNCLVIDAGTCITYDLVDSNKNYYGGSISPGLNMRYMAMHTQTQKLPLVAFDEQFKASYGDDTISAMRSGVQKGMLFEISGFIQHYKSQFNDLQIVLCGGDSKYFDTQLKNSIFAPSVKSVPHLVLIGLNEVIKQNND